MNAKESDNKQLALIIRLLPAVLTVLLLIGVVWRISSASEHLAGSAQILDDGWYLLRDGEQIPIQFSDTLDCEPGETVVLCNDSLGADSAGKLLTTRGAQYDLQILVNGEVLYRYEDEYFPRNTQMKSKQDCDAVIPEDFDGGTVELIYQAPSGGRLELTRVWIGTGSEIFIRHILDAGPTFAVAIIFGILGIIALGMAIYLRICALDARAVVDAALFLLISSIWFITDTSLVQQYAGSASVVCVISFYAFMLFSIPMLYLVKNTGSMSRYRALDVLIGLFYANAILQGILHLSLGIDFIDMLFMTHLLLFGGVLLVMILTIREYRKSQDNMLKKIIIAFSAVSVSGVLALLLYWLFKVPYYGSIFSAGILIFVILILANLIHTVANNIYYRTEMLIYQEMAKKDWMTGLGNRQPFDEYLSEVQNGRITCDRLALIFMDLNDLKYVNDEFGHAAGDELIVGAAKCIRNVFGDAGSCYRLGGDEFAVILKDVRGTAEEWFGRLDAEIEKFNRANRFRLSIARGWSELHAEDGLDKTISDWKREADSRMYEDKGRTAHS